MKIQLAEVAKAFAGALMRRGTISAGYSQVMPNQPIAKKVLKTKRKTAAVIPRPDDVLEVVPARTAMEAA